METNSNYDFIEILYDGVYHNSKGPAVIYPDGTEYWYLHGQLHRLDGPAVTLSNGTQYWYKFGQLHRKDGPAVRSINNPASNAWYLDGVQYTDPLEFQRVTNISNVQLLTLFILYGRLM